MTGRDWPGPLLPNVVKGSRRHSVIATTIRFYNQADGDSQAGAARVVDHLVSSPAKATDAELTPEANAAFPG